MAIYSITARKHHHSHMCHGKKKYIPLFAFIGVIIFLYVIIPLAVGCIKRRNGVLRLISTYIYLLMILWVVCIISSHLIKPMEKILSSCKHFTVLFRLTSYIVLVLSYFFVSIESFCGDEMKYLSNVMEKANAKAYLEELKQAKPQKLMKIRFSDEKLQKNFICCCDSGENDYNKPEPDEVPQVVKMQRQRFFEYTCFKDLTVFKASISDNPIILLSLSKLIMLGTKETRNGYQKQRNDMVADVEESYPNSEHGEAVIFECEDLIPNFKPNICVFTKHSCVSPCWLNKTVYILAILFGCSWPYRLLFKLITNNVHITICKELLICNIQDEECESCSQEEETGHCSFYAYEQLRAFQSRKKQQHQQIPYDEIERSSPHVVEIEPESPGIVDISDLGPRLMPEKHQLPIKDRGVLQKNPQSFNIKIAQSSRRAEPKEMSASERQPLLSNQRVKTYS